MLHLGSAVVSHAHAAGFTVNFSSDVSRLVFLIQSNWINSFKEHMDWKGNDLLFLQCDATLPPFLYERPKLLLSSANFNILEDSPRWIVNTVFFMFFVWKWWTSCFKPTPNLRLNGWNTADHLFVDPLFSQGVNRQNTALCENNEHLATSQRPINY